MGKTSAASGSHTSGNNDAAQYGCCGCNAKVGTGSYRVGGGNDKEM